jgi:hypothetical protein
MRFQIILGLALALTACAPAATNNPPPAPSATTVPVVSTATSVPPSTTATNAPAATSTNVPAAPVATSTSRAAAPTATSAPKVTSTAAQTSLRVIPNGTTKVEQLVGEEDHQLHKPTLSQTDSRFGVEGVDLGQSFENGGKVYFLFGDTVGKLSKALDTIAVTDATDPEKGVKLDFLMSGSNYLTVQPPGIKMGVDETPVGGITIGNQMYVIVSTDHSDDRSTDRTVLTKFTLPSTFTPGRTISQEPTGHFIKMSLHLEPAPIPGMPPGGPYIMMWGTGAYRQSDAFLSIIPVATFESGEGTRYFAGMDAAGAPKWSDKESDSVAIVKDGTMGDISVTWSKDLNLWLMTYDSRLKPPPTIQFSYSRTPWGPWEKPQTVYDPMREDGYGEFIHDARAKPDDGLEGPEIGQAQKDPQGTNGATYAPYVVERWTKLQGSELDIYYVLSTWNPYVVVLMKSRLAVQ